MPTPALHTAVPLVYPEPGSAAAMVREKVLMAAHDEPIECLYFGSSLHSFSTTSGSHFIGALNQGLASIYGEAFATQWIPPASFGSQPFAQFCIRSGRPNTVDPTGLLTDYVPPNWGVRKLSHATSNFAFQFEPDGWATCPLSNGTQGNYIPQGGTIKPVWIGWSIGEATGESAQDTAFGFITRKQAAGVTGAIFDGGTLLSNVTTVNIPATSFSTGQAFNPNATTHQARELDFPATNGAAGITYSHDTAAPYYSLQIASAATPTNYVLCAGARWMNLTNPKGIVVSTVSVGGAKMGDFLTSHSLSWETLRAMCGNRRRIVCISLQTNCAGNGITARDDEAESTSYYHLLVAFVRAIMTNLHPELIVLIGDGPRVDDSGSADEEFSRMVGADVQVAQLFGPIVSVVNLRRALERLGYSGSNETMTGYSFSNEWADTTEYGAGAVVSLGEPPNYEYWRCLVGHTAESTNKPGSGANWQTVWRRHRRRLAPGANLTTAPDDVVHPGGPGSANDANVALELLYSSLNGLRNPNRGRLR